MSNAILQLEVSKCNSSPQEYYYILFKLTNILVFLHSDWQLKNRSIICDGRIAAKSEMKIAHICQFCFQPSI